MWAKFATSKVKKLLFQIKNHQKRKSIKLEAYKIKIEHFCKNRLSLKLISDFAFYWKEKKKKPWREEKEKIETRQEIFLRNQICTWRGKDMKREIDELCAEPNLRHSAEPKEKWGNGHLRCCTCPGLILFYFQRRSFR